MYYSVVGGHPSTDTNVIPEQLLQTAYLLPANICASSPQFDGKYRTLAPFSAFSLILHSSLMFFYFFLPRVHLFPMFSWMLRLGMVYRRGWRQTKKRLVDMQKVCTFIVTSWISCFTQTRHPCFTSELFPLRFVSADVQVFTVTPVSGSSAEVAHDKQHLQSVRRMGFGLVRSDEWKLKVSLYADDTELSSRCHWDRQKWKTSKGKHKTRLSLKIMP